MAKRHPRQNLPVAPLRKPSWRHRIPSAVVASHRSSGAAGTTPGNRSVALCGASCSPRVCFRIIHQST